MSFIVSYVSDIEKPSELVQGVEHAYRSTAASKQAACPASVM